MKRMLNKKWAVYGEYGDRFSNLDDARQCAKLASTTPEYDYKATIWNLQDNMNYIDYEHGKCVRDDWTVHLTRTGETGRFNLGGKVVEKPIYRTQDGHEVVKYNNQLYKVNR